MIPQKSVTEISFNHLGTTQDEAHSLNHEGRFQFKSLSLCRFEKQLFISSFKLYIMKVAQQ